MPDVTVQPNGELVQGVLNILAETDSGVQRPRRPKDRLDPPLSCKVITGGRRALVD